MKKEKIKTILYWVAGLLSAGIAAIKVIMTLFGQGGN